MLILSLWNGDDEVVTANDFREEYQNVAHLTKGDMNVKHHSKPDKPEKGPDTTYRWQIDYLYNLLNIVPDGKVSYLHAKTNLPNTLTQYLGHDIYTIIQSSDNVR